MECKTAWDLDATDLAEIKSGDAYAELALCRSRGSPAQPPSQADSVTRCFLQVCLEKLL